MTAAWYDDRRNLAAVARYMNEQGDSAAEVTYMLEKPWKFEEDWRLSKLEGVGTGAGEGATGQDTGTAWVTRSEDCPEAPAQAHPLASDPAGVVADEAYVAGYQDGVTQGLRWAAIEWPEDGMTRAEAQAWLEQQAARLLCKGHQAASPTRRPCAACIQTATADRPEGSR